MSCYFYTDFPVNLRSSSRSQTILDVCHGLHSVGVHAWSAMPQNCLRHCKLRTVHAHPFAALLISSTAPKFVTRRFLV